MAAGENVAARKAKRQQREAEVGIGEKSAVCRNASKAREVAEPDVADRQAPREDWSSSRLRKVEELLDQLERRLQEGDFRPTVGDFIKLLQLHRELAQEQPKEIIVRWVEPSETDDASAG